MSCYKACSMKLHLKPAGCDGSGRYLPGTIPNITNQHYRRVHVLVNGMQIVGALHVTDFLFKSTCPGTVPSNLGNTLHTIMNSMVG